MCLRGCTGIFWELRCLGPQSSIPMSSPVLLCAFSFASQTTYAYVQTCLNSRRAGSFTRCNNRLMSLLCHGHTDWLRIAASHELRSGEIHLSPAAFPSRRRCLKFWVHALAGKAVCQHLQPPLLVSPWCSMARHAQQSLSNGFNISEMSLS